MEKKIFKKILWNDGGPNDKGTLQGFYEGFSEKQLKIEQSITHNFISFIEISKERYEELKRKAKEQYEMFK